MFDIGELGHQHVVAVFALDKRLHALGLHVHLKQLLTRKHPLALALQVDGAVLKMVLKLIIVHQHAFTFILRID